MDASSFGASPSLGSGLGSGSGSSSLQTFALFVNFFFPSLALVVVTTRSAGNLINHQFRLDDWLVCIAMVMSVAETVLSYFCKTSSIQWSLGIPADEEQSSKPTLSASP